MIESDNGGLDALRRLSDEDLAREAARGDERAARVLLERFEEPLYRYTVALIRDPDLAREATWSALFEAARAVRADEHSEPVAPWLFRIAHTAADVAGGRPEGREPGDEAAARAAAADEPDRERLEVMLVGLAALPDRDRGSLLLRELVGLEYAGIATVTGARPRAARQAVYRARVALLGGGEPPTEHCDEIRAAMSKAEVDVRERRSIASHLETCPACEQFARELEERPGDLRLLFPPPTEPLAAELVPPLPPVTAAPRSRARDRGSRRRPRIALVPLVLGLLLVGAAIATAIALNDNGGGKRSRASAASQGGAAGGAQARAGGSGKGTPSKSAKGKRTSKSHKAKAHKKPRAVAPTKPSKSKGSAGGKKSKGAAAGAGTGTGSSTSGGGSSGSGSEGAAPCPPGPAASPAQSGYSSGGGVAQAQIQDCAHASRRGASGALASTGLDLTPVVAAGLLLLGLGFVLRRLGTRAELRG